MSKEPIPTTLKSIRIKDAVIEALEDIGEAEGRNFSNLVNRILEQYVAANAKVVQLRRRK
jgi:uncharacterized protein (DUF4415 family)